MAEQVPTCTNDAQTLPALMNELKSVLNCSALENGGVLVALLPKHRCCAGNCRGVEPRENKPDGAVRPQEHSLEGLWEGEDIGRVFIHTVQGKPGYIFDKWVS